MRKIYTHIYISTHALLAEGDLEPRLDIGRAIFISTHALLAEGDQAETKKPTKLSEFQPTPSLRRATWSAVQRKLCIQHFNPRPPCGGRPQQDVKITHIGISTHALLAEGDCRAGGIFVH